MEQFDERTAAHLRMQSDSEKEKSFADLLNDLKSRINWNITFEGDQKRIFTQQDDGYFLEITKEEGKMMIRDSLPLATPATVNNLCLALLEDRERLIDAALFRRSREKIIGLLDGCFDLTTGKLRNYTSTDFCLTPLPHRLHHLPYTSDADAWFCGILASWVGDECADWFCNALAYCLFISPNTEQVWMNFFGMGSNGKSICLKLLERILGDEKVIGCDLANINRFSNATFKGKWLVIGRDSSSFVSDTATSFIKNYSGDDKGLVEVKGGGSFDAYTEGKLIVSTNTLIQSKDRTFSWFRRLFPVPFPHTFPRNPAFERGVMARLPEIIRVLLHRAYCYTKNATTLTDSMPHAVQDLLTETRYLNDRVAAYWETEFFTIDDKPITEKFVQLDGMTMGEVYLDYCDWHDKHYGDGAPEPSLKTFGGQYGAFMQHAKAYYTTKKTNRGRVVTLEGSLTPPF